MPTKQLRTIIESQLFSSDRDALGIDIRRLDEALFGVTWSLARNPEIGRETDVEDIQAIGIREVGGLPPLLVYYTWNESTVVLLSMIVGNSALEDF